MCDYGRLAAAPVVSDDGAIRVLRFDNPLFIAINARKGLGVIALPDDGPNPNHIP